MEFILFGIATIAILSVSFYRFHKAKRMVLNDEPSPKEYATMEYVKAYDDAFKEKGLHFKHYHSA